MRRVIGLDPGLRIMGWGIVDADNNRLNHVAHGTICSDATRPLAQRLFMLAEGLENVLTRYQPQEAAIEQSFVNRDGVATLKLGQARAICLLLPAQKNMNVAEYAPNFIKRAITGAGHADKKQILAMIKILLPKSEVQNEHAGDALAIAITHIHHSAQQKLLDAHNEIAS